MASFRLIDVSTSRLSADPDEERRQIADMLLTSRRNNADVQVTGALLATGYSFAQVLEGERADVEETYARIQRDPRHTDLVPILTDCIETRQFPEWSMAFIRPSQSAEQVVARLAQRRPATELGALARALLPHYAPGAASHSSGVRRGVIRRGAPRLTDSRRRRRRWP